MKKRVETIETKPLNKLFKDSFKKKVVQQIEDNILTYQQVKEKYGIGKTALSEWTRHFGKKAKREKQDRLARLDHQMRENKERSKFWQEFRRVKSEAELYKQIIELAKSRYGIDLKKTLVYRCENV